jgi:hypothetical protein
MPFPATVYRVMIGSPGDLGKLRDAVEAEIHAWNGEHAADKGAILLPVRWEVDATPRQGQSGQEVINEGLVRSSDVMIGMFWTRLGQQTSTERSGTVEEIREFARDGKPCGLFFKKGSMPMKHDADQYRKLQVFEQEVRDPHGEFRCLAK